jgi:hypothetical protein
MLAQCRCNYETTHLFCRIKSGNPGYLVAFNTADKEVTVSFNKLNHVPEELNVVIKSSSFNSTGIRAKLVPHDKCMFFESYLNYRCDKTYMQIFLPFDVLPS